MISVALANHRKEGYIQKPFMSDPIARAAMPILCEGNLVQ